ncbi:MAG: hypothetical protein N4A53_08200 [Pelagimonas sp.]|jgi:hypothetical protein|nr:hypothetical protein [Pelagimonas sp.]
MSDIKVHITDHALLRYLECVEGIDVEVLRKRLKKRVNTILGTGLEGPSAVCFDGIRCVIRDGRVVTIFSQNAPRRGHYPSGKSK